MSRRATPPEGHQVASGGTSACALRVRLVTGSCEIASPCPQRQVQGGTCCCSLLLLTRISNGRASWSSARQKQEVVSMSLSEKLKPSCGPFPASRTRRGGLGTEYRYTCSHWKWHMRVRTWQRHTTVGTISPTRQARTNSQRRLYQAGAMLRSWGMWCSNWLLAPISHPVAHGTAPSAHTHPRLALFASK